MAIYVRSWSHRETLGYDPLAAGGGTAGGSAAKKSLAGNSPFDYFDAPKARNGGLWHRSVWTLAA